MSTKNTATSVLNPASIDSIRSLALHESVLAAKSYEELELAVNNLMEKLAASKRTSHKVRLCHLDAVVQAYDAIEASSIHGVTDVWEYLLFPLGAKDKHISATEELALGYISEWITSNPSKVSKVRNVLLKQLMRENGSNLPVETALTYPLPIIRSYLETLSERFLELFMAGIAERLSFLVFEALSAESRQEFSVLKELNSIAFKQYLSLYKTEELPY